MHLQILPNVRGRTPELDWYYVSILNKCKWALLVGGEPMMWYQRRWTGVRCPNYSQTKKQHAIDTDQDDGCFGVGFVGGYYRPIQIYVSLLSANAVQNVVQEDGVRKIFRPKSWTLREPNLRNGDFILRQNGERHWISDITPTRWRSHIIRQTFSTDLVEKNHPIYFIPV